MSVDAGRNSETMNEAAKTLMGVISARLGGNVDDASMLISSYLFDSMRRGHSLSEAWALLFSASAVVATDLVQELAVKNGQSGQAELADLALHHAF